MIWTFHMDRSQKKWKIWGTSSTETWPYFIALLKKFILIFRERGKDRETEKSICCPLTAFIDWFSHVPWLGIEPITVTYWDKALTYLALGQGYSSLTCSTFEYKCRQIFLPSLSTHSIYSSLHLLISFVYQTIKNLIVSGFVMGVRKQIRSPPLWNTTKYIVIKDSTWKTGLPLHVGSR